MPDYQHELFECIETARTSYLKLPEVFVLSDASLAAMITVSLDTDDISTDRIKMLRHMLHKRGLTAAWATSRKISL